MSGLPLEVLGMIGPILCWVERVEKPGFPDNWYGERFPFKDRLRAWLMRDLPTYSYDNLEEIMRLARDRRKHPNRFPDEPPGSTNRRHVSAPPEGFELVYMFHKLSRHYLRWAGNELCIRGGRMVELHELAMRFPLRHLIRYCHADAVIRGYMSVESALKLPVQMSQLHTTFQSLRTVVNEGLSEGHLHLNGVICADEAWADQLLRNLSPAALEGASHEEKKLIALSRSALRLLTLGVLYSLLKDEGTFDTFIEKEEKIFGPPFHLIAYLDRLYGASDYMVDYNAIKVLNMFVSEAFNTLHGRMMRNVPGEWMLKHDWLLRLAMPGMHRLRHSLTGDRSNREITGPGGIRNRIQLLDRLHFKVHRILVESNVRLGREMPVSGSSASPVPAFDKKRYSKQVRDFIHQVFMRYLIYHTHHWQKATQSGKTTGLRYFQRFYDAPQRELMTTGSQMEEQGLVIERLSRAKPLRTVEGRLSPPSGGAARYLPWLLAFAKEADEGQLDKFGIVVHFLKEEHRSRDTGASGKERRDLRHGHIRRTTRTKAFKLFRLLATPGPVVPFIVGIDAANLELTTPPEVFAPAFRFLRAFPIKLRHCSTTREKMTRKYREIFELVKTRRLGMTYHVGEDFRHLLSGLRAIHEVIEFLKPLPGDRLGHAIALALDPEVWAAQMGYQSVLPRQEWLDTLVWVHHFLGAGQDLIGQLAVEDRIQRESIKIYRKIDIPWKDKLDLDPPTLYDAWRLRQLDPYSVELFPPNFDGFRIRRRGGYGTEHLRWANVQKKVLGEVNQFIGSKSAYRLAHHYWNSNAARWEGDRIITIDMKKNKEIWLDVCREAQSRLRKIVQEKQLVVEVNPSSNRVIGPMSKLDEHPVFKLTLDKNQRLAREIRVTINTDDPGVFSTSLPHEFYLLGESLLNRGVPETEVVEWLNWLRKNGKDYSFLRELPEKNDPHMAEILKCLREKYEPLLRRLRGERRKYRPPGSRFKSKPKPEEEYRQLKARIEALEGKP